MGHTFLCNTDDAARTGLSEELPALVARETRGHSFTVRGTGADGESTVTCRPLATSASAGRGSFWVVPSCLRGIRYRPSVLACALLYLKVGSLYIAYRGFLFNPI